MTFSMIQVATTRAKWAWTYSQEHAGGPWDRREFLLAALYELRIIPGQETRLWHQNDIAGNNGSSLIGRAFYDFTINTHERINGFCAARAQTLDRMSESGEVILEREEGERICRISDDPRVLSIADNLFVAIQNGKWQAEAKEHKL